MKLREPLLPIVTTAVIALVLSAVPLPRWLDVIRPAFVAMIVLYWSVMTPFTAGIALAFLAGIALDVFQNALLGQHALALSTISYLAINFHLQLRAKPLFEQCIYVLIALLLYEGVLWLVDGSAGLSLNSPLRLLHALTGMLLWPFATGFLGRLHAPR